MQTDIVRDVLQLPGRFPGMQGLSISAVYLMGCRDFSQFCSTLRSLADAERFCPFCATELTRRNRKPLASADGWLLLENEYPHGNTSRMLLIVPERHITQLSDISSKDSAAIFSLANRAGIASGGIMFRFGDPHFNAGTISHLHVNLIEPICGEDYRPPFAKAQEKHEIDYGRMLKFRDILQHKGGEEWLFSVEGIQETEPAI